jgi:hypothetical protein
MQMLQQFTARIFILLRSPGIDSWFSSSILRYKGAADEIVLNKIQNNRLNWLQIEGKWSHSSIRLESICRDRTTDGEDYTVGIMPNGFWNVISMDELIIKTPKQNVVTIKKLTWRGTLRQVSVRVFRLETASVPQMLLLELHS